MSVSYPRALLAIRVLWEDGAPAGQVTLGKQETLVVTPKRITVALNSYREADTFSCTLDYRQFPFDPRSIRALGVTVFMRDMKALRDSAGKPIDFNLDVDSPTARKDVVFQGFADEESIEFNDSTREVSFEGRDFTALLIDRPYLGGSVPMNKPVDQIVQALLNELPETRLDKNKGTGIEVVNATGKPLPVYGRYASDAGTNQKLAGRKNPKKDQSYWELIQELVGRSALVAYIEIDQLIISEPRVLYDRDRAVQMIWGKNLKDLSYKRKLGRLKGFNIEVRSMSLSDPSVGIVTARIPEEATEEWSRSVGIRRAAVTIPKRQADGTFKDEVAPYYAFFVPDMPSKAELIQHGQRFFEEVGRQEIEGKLVTKDMQLAEEGSGNAREILTLRTGTPLAIYVDDADIAQVGGSFRSIQERARFLVGMGYDPQLASVMATALDTARDIFYTKAVEFTLDEEGGFSASIEFLNYIVTNKVKR